MKIYDSPFPEHAFEIRTSLYSGSEESITMGSFLLSYFAFVVLLLVI